MKRINRNYDFDLLLDVDYLLKQIQKLDLVLGIFKETAPLKPDKIKTFELRNLLDQAHLSWVSVGQLETFRYLSYDIFNLGDSIKLNTENSVTLNSWVSIKAELNCLLYYFFNSNHLWAFHS